MKFSLYLPVLLSFFLCLTSDVSADLERHPIRRHLLGSILAALPVDIDLEPIISIKVGVSAEEEEPEKDGGRIPPVKFNPSKIGRLVKGNDRIYNVNAEDCNVNGVKCNMQFNSVTESAKAEQKAKGNDQIYKVNAEDCDVDGEDCNVQYGDVTETETEAGQ